MANNLYIRGKIITHNQSAYNTFLGPKYECCGSWLEPGLGFSSTSQLSGVRPRNVPNELGAAKAESYLTCMRHFFVGRQWRWQAHSSIHQRACEDSGERFIIMGCLHVLSTLSSAARSEGAAVKIFPLHNFCRVIGISSQTVGRRSAPTTIPSLLIKNIFNNKDCIARVLSLSLAPLATETHALALIHYIPKWRKKPRVPTFPHASPI